MATFEEHIEGLTQIDITSSSAPTTNELTEILRESLINTVNKIIALRPGELSKFTKTTNATSPIEKKGVLLSVLREHDNTDILRVCTPINASLRYEATDVESLHYRSKYNPGYYELDGNVHCVPQAASGNNDIIVTQVHYDTGLAAGDNYNSAAIENFPLDYEYLVALYAAAMACNAAAGDIQNNMPDKPITPADIQLSSPPVAIDSPNIIVDNVVLPTAPNYVPVAIDFNLNSVLTALNNEDIEKAEKELELVEKKLSKFDKDKENNVQLYTKEVEVFGKDLERLTKNADRDSQIKVAQYKSIIEKYNADVINYQQEAGLVIGRYTQDINKFTQNLGKYGAELQEVTTKYKWFQEQYIALMTQYNNGIIGTSQTPAKQKEEER